MYTCPCSFDVHVGKSGVHTIFAAKEKGRHTLSAYFPKSQKRSLIVTKQDMNSGWSERKCMKRAEQQDSPT